MVMILMMVAMILMMVMIHLTRFNLPPPKPGPDTHGSASPAEPIERARTT